MNEYTKAWFRAAVTRALKTIAQAAAATIGASAVISEVNWAEVVSAALLAGLFSLLTSVAGLPELSSDNKYVVEHHEVPEDEENI